jgi:hypothetical protein
MPLKRERDQIRRDRSAEHYIGRRYLRLSTVAKHSVKCESVAATEWNGDAESEGAVRHCSPS